MGIARHFMRRAVDLQHGFPGSHSIDAVGAHYLGQLDFVAVDYSGLIGVLLRLLKFQVGFGGAICIEYAPRSYAVAKPSERLPHRRSILDSLAYPSPRVDRRAAAAHDNVKFALEVTRKIGP